MFHYAVLKLTGWYVLILMSTSLLFSLAIYNVTTSEIRDRLSDLQAKLEERGLGALVLPTPDLFTTFEQNQFSSAERNLFLTLLYVNMFILMGGGALCFMLARRSLRKIEEAHEAQSRFTSDASHELRTPLAVMKSEIEVALRDKNLSKDEMRELLESNLEEVNKLTSLSQTLLQLSRLDFTNLEFETLDLGPIATEIVKKYDKKSGRVHLDVGKSVLATHANRASMEELFTILVDNALKYSPKGTKIVAKLSKRPRNLRFTISNTGKGIAKNEIPHVFDRFYRSDLSRNTKGTGLGLALAKEIVSVHGGEISVKSTPDKITTFTVVLPTKSGK